MLPFPDLADVGDSAITALRADRPHRDRRPPAQSSAAEL